MIFGIGTDIVRIARMRQDLERYGERFAERILADDELAEFRADPRPAHFLAKRFAAKEAAVKAMGTGFRDGVTLRDVAVGHDELGKPLLNFTARAREFVEAHGITTIHVSLADEDEYAGAFVTLAK